MFGHLSKRWLPYGMPQISPKIAKSTFYLYGIDPETNNYLNDPGGTGFIVTRNVGVTAPLSVYAVSNWHVVSYGGNSNIRLNLKTGGYSFIHREPDEWQCIKKYDLAAIDITDEINSGIYETSSIFEHEFISKNAIENLEVTMGDDVFMVGYYVNNYGEEENLPAARFGNISRIANIDHPVCVENIGEFPCHLIDMRSRTGFSGSPVFIYRTPATDLTQVHAGGGNIILPH